MRNGVRCCCESNVVAVSSILLFVICCNRCRVAQSLSAWRLGAAAGGLVSALELHFDTAEDHQYSVRSQPLRKQTIVGIPATIKSG